MAKDIQTANYPSPRSCEKTWRTRRALLAPIAALMLSNAAAAQEEADEARALAERIQNPLASLVTLPLQANFGHGVGPFDRKSFNLNIQPVIPVTGEKWNVIARTIIPVNSVPVGLTDSTFGIGDTSFSLFWTPAKAKQFIWGVGPAFIFPTASTEVLGTDQWGAGPTGVVFYQTGKWTMGAVASNVWSVAGGGGDSINLLTAQYFANYNFGRGWAVGTAPTITANWKADSDNTWTVPWGLQISKVTSFGAQSVNLLFGYYKNATRPDGAADSQLRFQLNFLFPGT